MSRHTKFLVNILITIICLGYIIISVVTLRQETSDKTFMGVRIEIADSIHCGLIQSHSLRDMILDSVGEVGVKFSEIDLRKIEEIVNNNQYVEWCEVLPTMEGEVVVKIIERKPVLRLKLDNGSDFYVDTLMEAMELVSWYRPIVPIITGNIQITPPTQKNNPPHPKKTEKETEKIKKLINFAKSIESDTYFASLIAQIYAKDDENNKVEVQLFLNINCGIVLFGQIDNPKKKIKKLSKFFENAYKYSKINDKTIVDARFNEQIVTREQKTKKQ